MKNPKNNRIEDGPYVLYHDNGKKKEEGTYKNGEKEGPYIRYYSDGGKLEGTYKNGTRVK